MAEQVVLGPETQSRLNVIPGLLDLPAAFVDDRAIETYLKALALFYRQIIIPDGWLHCAGPITEYLRRQLRKGEMSAAYTGNVVHELMRAGIIWPALRGNHANAGEQPRGFDLYQVWCGGVRDRHGKGFGVNIEEAADRLMILDPNESAWTTSETASENHLLIRDTSESVQQFLSWDAPTVPITTPAPSALARWNQRLTKLTKENVFDNELIYRDDDLPFLEKTLGVGHVGRLALGSFMEALTDRLRTYTSSADLRRGHFERAMGESLTGITGRLTSYEDLAQQVHRPGTSINPHVAASSADRWLDPASFYASILLDRVSTIQEAMFAKKFKASLGMCVNWSSYVLNTNELTPELTPLPVEEFMDELQEIAIPRANLAGLSVTQIVKLRRKHAAYFDLLEHARPAKRFWKNNQELLRVLTAYLNDIVAATPLHDLEKSATGSITGGATKAGDDGLVAFAKQGTAALIFAGMPIAVWVAKGSRLLIRGRLKRALDDKLESYVRRIGRRPRVDLLLRMWGVKERMPQVHKRR